MAYVYGSTITGNYNGEIRKWRTYLSYTKTSTETTVTVKVSIGVEARRDPSMGFSAGTLTGQIISGSVVKAEGVNSSKWTLAGIGTKKVLISTKTYTYNKGSSSRKVPITGKIRCSSSSAWAGTSTAELVVGIPALSEVEIPSYSARRKTSDNGYKENADISFEILPPFDITLKEINILKGTKAYNIHIKKVVIGPPKGSTAPWVPLPAGINKGQSAPVELSTTNGDFNEFISHTLTVQIKYTLKGGTTTYKAEETVTLPATDQLWTASIDQRVPLETDMPFIRADGTADVNVYLEKNGVYELYDPPDLFVSKVSSDIFNARFTIDETYVSDEYSYTPEINVRLDVIKTDTDTPEADEAFFLTTRNINFSNGLANSVFIGGCTVEKFSSRVWYSYVNNPLYFPDTNYIEVGSIDTAVMGLTKVGEYLGIVKQGKTTDTSIFLAYPTSFDNDTAYAVKQSISGVGANGRYTFNIMNQETLFLSENGIMAIELTEDDNKRVRNRSYFIDRKLAEENAKDAYSFVHENMYFLAFPNGHCYVLDGSQRNSWGNDKTNLVYECYYLENVPMNNIIKYDGELWFSDPYGNLCAFGDSYEDGYSLDVTQEDSFVKARWSTLLDDDNALQYYKTMQKKGNLVSILPMVSENTKVYVKKDAEEPTLIERDFNEPSNIPSELYINRKFKKYKRLQFIVENNDNEGFGVDSIIKNYTVGNYSKK